MRQLRFLLLLAALLLIPLLGARAQTPKSVTAGATFANFGPAAGSGALIVTAKNFKVLGVSGPLQCDLQADIYREIFTPIGSFANHTDGWLVTIKSLDFIYVDAITGYRTAAEATLWNSHSA